MASGKSKVRSAKEGSFAKGGGNKMVGQQHSGQQLPGQTATNATSSNKFAEGGNGHMSGPNSSKTATPA